MAVQEAGHRDIILYVEGPLKARYISGLMMYEESMYWDRWIGRHWTPSGYVEFDFHLNWVEQAAHTPARTAGLDLAAFALEVDGQSLHFGWKLERMAEAPASCPGSRHAVVTLRSTLRPFTVEVHTEVDGTGFLCRWLRITNTGGKPSAMGAVWPMSGLLDRVEDWRALLGHDGPVYSVGYMTDRSYGNEGAFDWQPLPGNRLCLESRMGKSGYGMPFFIVRNTVTGQYIVGALAWSGNWEIDLTAEQLASSDSFLWFRIGPTNPSPQRVIAPGETVETPPVHLGMLESDFDGAIQAWHRHLRQSVLPPQIPGRESLVFYNGWGYAMEEMTEERLKLEIDAAVDVGAELFTIDAGWFGNKGSDFFKVVGDWECGNRLPNGLEPVIAYAREKGLLLSMWFDLEHIGADSRVAREHPDWVIRRFGRVGSTLPRASHFSRSLFPAWQLDEYHLGMTYGVADLSNPEVVEYLEGKAVGIIERYGLDVFRIDFNVQPYEEGRALRDGFLENTAWRHYENAYALYDRIRRRFPNLIMENCSGGGGRADLGLASRFHHNLISDWSVAPRTARIITGMTMALPPERVDRMVGAPGASTMRGDLDFHFRSAMLGHLTLSGIYPSPRERNPQHVERIRHHVDVYKRCIRPILGTCRVHFHTPVLKGQEPRGWAVLEYTSEDDSRGFIVVFRLPEAHPDAWHLVLRGVDAGARYRVTSDNTGQSFEREGAALKQDGLVVRLAEPLSSELLTLEKVAKA